MSAVRKSGGASRFLVIASVAVLAAYFLGRYYEPEARLPSVMAPDGYRMENYRAPTPIELPGATVVDTQGLLRLLRDQRPILVDVTPKGDEPRMQISDSLWLPNMGYGDLTDQQVSVFSRALQKVSSGAVKRPFVFYCLADCWLSWNAAKRAVALGVDGIYWYPAGSDGWREAGLPLVEAEEPLSFGGEK